MDNLSSFDERNPNHPKHPDLSDIPWAVKAATAVFLGAVAVGLGVFIGYVTWGL